MRLVGLMYVSLLALLVASMPSARAETSGKQVFDHYCAHCHGAGDAPGTLQLGRTRGKDRALLAARSDLAPDFIEHVVRHGLKSMPPFTPSDLNDADLEALVRFLTK